METFEKSNKYNFCITIYHNNGTKTKLRDLTLEQVRSWIVDLRHKYIKEIKINSYLKY